MISILKPASGNIFNVRKSLEHLGLKTCEVSHPEEVLEANKLIIIGVGAFSQTIEGLKEKCLDQAIAEFSHTGRPLLGICVGMQVFMTKGYEFNVTQGLGLIEGDCVPLRVKEGVKLPHIGFAPLTEEPEFLTYEISQSSEINRDDFYYAHSFYCQPKEESVVQAYSEYAGFKFPAILKKENILGCQFHPELSGYKGLDFYQSFNRI